MRYERCGGVGWTVAGLRTVGARSGVDRKTARRCTLAAQEAGLCRNAAPEALTDELIGVVVARCGRTGVARRGRP